MNIEGWQAIIGGVLTIIGTTIVARWQFRGTRETTTATTGAEIIGQLRQQIDSQHIRFAEDLAANRTEHERQMTAIRTEHDKQRQALEEIVDEARKDRRLLGDYIAILRRHIETNTPPPPPPYPTGLMT